MSGGPAEELVAAGYAWEIADAPWLHQALGLADLAHCVELADRGILPDRVRGPLLGALLDLAAMPADAVGYDPRYGEPYVSRERHLLERIGEEAGWLRAGRTRREAVRTAFRIRVRGQILDLVEAACALAATLAGQAERHAGTLMPDYTYLQQAQPTTFGHYLLSFADPVLRDAVRLLAEFGHVNAGLAGAGAANGSPILDDREAAARALGFDRAITHTRDAMWQTDPFMHVLAAATSLLLTQDKLAEDLEIFAGAEFGFVALAEAYARPSVAMPQKRNPYSLAVIRGSAGVMLGRLTGLTAVIKTPSARSDNLIYLYGELPRSLDLAHRATRLTTGVIRTLETDPARMRQALEAGFTQAADLAELLMRRFHLDYRTAHRVVQHAVQHEAALDAEAIARAAAAVTGDRLQFDDAELQACLTPEALVGSRTGLGGAAPSAMTPMIKGVREQAAELNAEAAARRAALHAAEEAIRARARSLAGR
ncbi:lyase family protein [Nonomuraea sediminis]|uniref:lyase family protein n=1 Tax=Nonomuraea sediminis TaxID=2835864 RepID=UPI001BDD5795|nr:lyase family protein [Nonomuraea sediminis]